MDVGPTDKGGSEIQKMYMSKSVISGKKKVRPHPPSIVTGLALHTLH